jgi:hypothetical protein
VRRPRIQPHRVYENCSKSLGSGGWWDLDELRDAGEERAPRKILQVHFLQARRLLMKGSQSTVWDGTLMNCVKPVRRDSLGGSAGGSGSAHTAFVAFQSGAKQIGASSRATLGGSGFAHTAPKEGVHQTARRFEDLTLDWLCRDCTRAVSGIFRIRAHCSEGRFAFKGKRLVIYCQTTSVSAVRALRIVLRTVPRVGRSCELFPEGFYLHLLRF